MTLPDSVPTLNIPAAFAPASPHSRELLHRRYWDRITERKRRLGVGVREAFQLRLPPQFIDYWPGVPATLPEKMLFIGLANRSINFYFSYHFGDFPFTPEYERYRPDFILPDYRIIIEVQGVYWHTRPGMPEHDATKYALFTAAGYKIYLIPDMKILEDSDAVLESIPEIRAATVKGNFIGIGDRPLNPTASITARIRRYPKVFVSKPRGVSPGARAIKAAGKAVRPVPASEPLFDPADLGEEYLQRLRDYGRDWLDYMTSLRNFFQDPNARIAYPYQYAYLQKWDGWWNRYSTTYAPEVYGD